MEPITLDPFAGMTTADINTMLIEVHRSPIAVQTRQDTADRFDDTRSWVDPNGYRLSDRLWNQREAIRKQIDARLQLGISRGEDALSVARDLEGYLNPAYRPTRTRNGRVVDDGRRGVLTRAPYRGGQGSYAARRLARTEVTRAFGQTTDVAAVGLELPVKWNLSNRHPEADRCDDNASGSSVGLPAGVYHVHECPTFPDHPHCLCTKTVHDERSEDDLVAYLRKKYDLPETGVFPESAPSIPGTVTPPTAPAPRRETPSERVLRLKEEQKVIAARRAREKARETRATNRREKIIRADELTIQTQRFETAIVYDDAGRVILRKDGGQYEVEFSAAESASMAGGRMTHNHPRGWDELPDSPMRRGSSFSTADYAMFASADLEEMRAISPAYRFTIKRRIRGAGGPRPPRGSWGKIDSDIRTNIEPRIYGELHRLIASGEITPKHANIIHSDLRGHLIADAWGIEYKAERLDPTASFTDIDLIERVVLDVLKRWGIKP